MKAMPLCALLTVLALAGCGANHKPPLPPPCLSAEQAHNLGAIDGRNAPPPCPASVTGPARR